MSLRQSSNDLSQELSVMSDVFSDLGERLIHAARQLQSPGSPPPEPLVAELSASRSDFVDIRDRTRALAESLHVAFPPAADVQGLQDLASWLDQVAEAEVCQSRNEEVRSRALSVLERVNQIAHVSDGDFSALRACQDRAGALHDEIANGSWTSLPAESEPLAEGDHPFAHLLRMIEDRDELSDDLWSTLHDSVVDTFGKSLAAATARSKLAISMEHAGSVG